MNSTSNSYQTVHSLCEYKMANTTFSPTMDTAMNDTSWIEYWLETYRPFERISQQLIKIASPIVLVFGIFGNVMVLLIMRRFTDSSLSVFFQVLAWSDQTLLTVSLLPLWLKMVFGTPHIEDLGTLPCKLSKFINYAAGWFSPWMLVSLTMQRAASVLWPHRIGAVWTKRKSQTHAGILIVIFTVSNCHVLIGYEMDKKVCADYVTKCCLVADALKGYYWHVFPWMNLFMFSFLPTILLISSNCILLWNLAASVKPGKHLPVNQATQDSRQRNVSSLIVTLLTVSASFYLLTIPMPIFLVSVRFLITPTIGNWNPVLTGQYRIFEATASTLWYCNSATNFYLYCLTGRKFRAEFQNMAVQFCRLFHKTQTGAAPQTSVPSSTVASSRTSKAVDSMKDNNRRTAVPNSDF